MKKVVFSFFLVVICKSAFPAIHADLMAASVEWRHSLAVNQSSDIDSLKSRLKQFYITTSLTDGVWMNKMVNSMKPDGSWADISYDNPKSMSVFSPIEHLARITGMCASYASPKTQFYNDPKLLKQISTGLSYWFRVKPVSPNFWWNQIGVPIKTQQILILVDQNLPKDVFTNCVNSLTDLKTVSPNLLTAENDVWYTTQQLIKGIEIRNTALVEDAFNRIKAEIVVGGKEGIQSDNSFYQHGAQLYNAGYGLEFLKDCLFFAYIAKGTAFEFDTEKLNVLSNFLLGGIGRMTKGGVIDYNSNGRAISRKDNNGQIAKVQYCTDLLTDLLPANKRRYATLRSSLTSGGSSFTGNKYFWKSDFMTQQRNGYYYSIKMVSSRTNGTEIGNGENLKGSWLPFGSTFLIKTGSEYKDIFPVWNWLRVPGVTSYNHLFTANLKTNIINADNQNMVSGVSDGMYGIASMQLNQRGLTGNKSWFCFDDAIVALGNNITAVNDTSVVSTTINQCLLKNDVLVSKLGGTKSIQDGSYNLTSVSWILQDGTGYLFPDKTKVNLKVGLGKGSWGAINKMYSAEQVQKRIFLAWFDHGTSPVNQKYSYIILPSIGNKTQMESYAANPSVKIIANNESYQVVSDTKKKITGFVFYKPGKVSVNAGLSLAVNKPCLVLLNQAGGKNKLSVATFDYNDNVITVKLLNQGVLVNKTLRFTNVSVNGVTKSIDL